MMIDFFEVKRQYSLYQREYEDAALRVLRSGWYILGTEVDAFEKAFSDYLGMAYCIGVNSGQDALILAVRALGIGRGDEVITPANTFIASVFGITENDAMPVFVEPDEFFSIDSSKIEAAITKRTKAILPVHLYGQACNMEKIRQLADQYGLFVIEDCAQSHGACFGGKKTGTYSDIACFSFYPTKPIGALGDAGALATNNPVLAERLRMLRNYGSKKKYVNEILGINSRLDELQAALLQVGLKHVDCGNAERIRIAMRYSAEIKNIRLYLPRIRDKATHVFHIYPVLCKERDALRSFLHDNGIATQIHYPIPPHLAKCFESYGYRPGSYPIAERFANEELSLPIYVGLTDQEIDYIVTIVNRF